MKLKDIKKFTSEGNYAVDYPLRYIPGAIKHYQDEYRLQLNPDFQRGHVWTPEQETAFMEFLLRGGKTARTIYFNHPGWKNARYDDGEFVCVDGLQRLTSILKFMDNKVPVFGGNYLKDIEDFPRLDMSLSMRFNINDLKTRKEVLQWYLEFNTGGTVHSEAEIKRIKELIKKESV